MKTYLTQCLCFCMALSSALYAEIRGKLDLGPAYIHVDVLESGKTVKAMHMGALKGDATVLVWKGVGFKGGFLAASGEGDLLSGAVGAGHYTPLSERITLFPSVGATFTYLRTTIDIEEQQLFHVKERFRSVSPYIALEFTFKIDSKWSVVGMYQYAWSRTHTKLTTTRRSHVHPLVTQLLETEGIVGKKIHSSHGHSDGANYSLGVDYTINDNWSVNVGGAYNLTLSKEKHGLRGYGFKVGTAYYF